MNPGPLVQWVTTLTTQAIAAWKGQNILLDVSFSTCLNFVPRQVKTSFQPRLFQTRCTNLKFWFCFLLRIWSVFQSAFEIQAQLLEKAKYDGCSAFVEMVPLSQIHLSVVVRALGSFSVVYSCWFNRLLASASLRASKTLKERIIIRAGYEPCGFEWKD